MPDIRVGFLGIGSMGSGMSLRLLDAGFALTVCDPNPDAVAEAKAQGASVAATAKEVADNAEIVFACLPSPDVSLEVALGADGIVHGRAVELYVETSTIGRATANALAEALGPEKIGLVDAPVSGGPDGARTGTLSTIVAAPEPAFARVRPLLETYAREIFHIGETPGQAQTAKLINNLLSSAAKVVTFEGFALAEKAGIDPEKLIDFINVSTGRNMATLEVFPDRLLRLFRSAGPKSIGIKDLELFLKEAAAHDAPADLAAKLLELQVADGAYGLNARNTSRIAPYIERLKELDAKRRKG